MPPISYRYCHFPPTIIQHSVWLYARFSLSFRDVEDLLAERGIIVSYETIRRWVAKFGPQLACRLRFEIWASRFGTTRRAGRTTALKDRMYTCGVESDGCKVFGRLHRRSVFSLYTTPPTTHSIPDDIFATLPITENGDEKHWASGTKPPALSHRMYLLPI